MSRYFKSFDEGKRPPSFIEKYTFAIGCAVIVMAVAAVMVFIAWRAGPSAARNGNGAHASKNNGISRSVQSDVGLSQIVSLGVSSSEQKAAGARRMVAPLNWRANYEPVTLVK